MHDLVLPLCSPEYQRSFQGHAKNPAAQFSAARLIDSVKMLYRWDVWLAANGIDIPDLSYPFRFDRSSMAIEIAKQGGGLALESVTLCLSELERGDLVPFCPAFAVIDFPAYWFVCPPQHFHRRAVNRFAEWLGAVCEEHEARARSLLESLGCCFRPVSEPELIDVKPTGL